MAALTMADMMSRTRLMAKKKGWIKKAISHPGRETKRAKEHGISVHGQMAKDSHSPDKSLRAAGNLGLRLTGSKPLKKRSPLHDHPRSTRSA